ncbi:hypothetical protein NQZ68_020035 [Dissostichus eleginoides]|nr:hypothetical protein NQZ68_020035 [Dissostichus eleginoides]
MKAGDGTKGLGKVNEKIRSAGTPDLLIFVALTQQFFFLPLTKSQQSCLPVSLSLISQHPSSPEMTLGMVKPPVEPWCVAVAPVSREVLGPDADKPQQAHLLPRCSSANRTRAVTGLQSEAEGCHLDGSNATASSLLGNTESIYISNRKSSLQADLSVSVSLQGREMTLQPLSALPLTLTPSPLSPTRLLFPSDGGEMDGWERMILMAETSVKLTNGSPKLGKPLAEPKQE